ncbi:MAG: GNAT family protein [Eubacteriales bacterium]
MELRHARLEERRKTYEWSLSIVAQDATSGWPEGPKHSYADFKEDFEDFFYMEHGRNKGGVLIIEVAGEEIGCVCYTCFHLKKGMAELDIWLKDAGHCGHGYGPKAITLLVEYLKNELNISRMIIRPKAENVRAIRAYEKVGFRRVDDAAAAMGAYLKPEYTEVYGNEEEDRPNTILLILE